MMRFAAVALTVSLAAPVVNAAEAGARSQSEAERVDAEKSSELSQPDRHVILMPVVGIWSHPFELDGWTGKSGPVWGLDVKVEPYRWLGVRASFLRGNQPVGIEPDASQETRYAYQPNLATTQLELRVEPMLSLTRNLSGYAGLGLFWARCVAPEPTTIPATRTLDRSAVHVGYEGAFGIAYEPFADRIVLDLSIAGALLTKQTGSAYDEVQAFSASGHRSTLGGLPHFSSAARAMFGIGFVL